jgi:hypothetical protein
MFNGNTAHNIMCGSNLQNRFVAIYRPNSSFKPGNMLMIGGQQNTLEKAFGTLSFPDMEYILEQMIKIEEQGIETYGLSLSKNPSVKEIEDFCTTVDEIIEYTSNGKISYSDKPAKNLKLKLIDRQTGTKRIKSVDNGTEVLKELSKAGFVDTPTLHYVCLSSMHKTLFFSLMNDMNNINTNNDARKDVIIHAGVPDPARPVDDWFESMMDFWKGYQGSLEFLRTQIFSDRDGGNAVLRGKYQIIGGFQQVRELEELLGWKYGDVIPFTDIKREYNKRYSHKKQKNKNTASFNFATLIPVTKAA